MIKSDTGRTCSKHGSCKELVEYLAGRGEGKRLFGRGHINCRKRSNAMFKPYIIEILFERVN
jgi:hypothetical protein